VTIQAGVAVADYGQSGQGYLLATADLNYAPYLDVVSWEGSDPFTGANHTVHVRMGQLDGLAGLGAQYGLWAGKDSDHYVLLSDQNAIIHGLKQQWVDASDNVRGEVLPTASGSDTLFWLGPNSSDPRLRIDANGVVYIGSDDVPADDMAGWAYPADTTKIDGGDIYAYSVTADKLEIREGSGNLIPNSDFSLGESYWTLSGDEVVVSTWGEHYYGPRSGYIHGALETTKYIRQEISVEGGRTYTLSVYYCSWNNSAGTTNPYYRLRIIEYEDTTWLEAHTTGLQLNIGNGNYQRARVTVETQSNCNKLVVDVYIRDVTGYFRFDCFQLERGSYASPWRPCSASGVFIDGGHILVGTPSDARIEINSDEIAGYSDATTKQFYIRSSDGRAMFGGGQGVLDSTGLTFDGTAESIDAYNSIAWRSQVDPPGGNEVARIAGGFYGSGGPELSLIVNRNREYELGFLTLETKGQGDIQYYSRISLGNGGTEGGYAYIHLYSYDADGSCGIDMSPGTGEFNGIRFMVQGNYWMRLAPTGQLELRAEGSSAGILIGGDTQLYRSAADVLYSPDTLAIEGAMLVGSGASSTNAKMHVYNSTLDTDVSYSIIRAEATKTAGASNYNHIMRGSFNYLIINQAGGEVGHTYGVDAWVRLQDGTVGNAVSGARNLHGIRSIAQVEGGTVTANVEALRAFANLDAGTVSNNAIALFGWVDQEAANTVDGDIRGLYLQVDADGAVTGNTYMIYLDERSNVDYGIYQNGNAPNYFGGLVGIGTEPQQHLHVAGVIRADIRFDLGTATGASGSAGIVTDVSFSATSWGQIYTSLVEDVSSTEVDLDIDRTGLYHWMIDPTRTYAGDLNKSTASLNFAGGIYTGGL